MDRGATERPINMLLFFFWFNGTGHNLTLVGATVLQPENMGSKLLKCMLQQILPNVII